MAPVFACGMPNPWGPPWAPAPGSPATPVVYQPPACDHCFCRETDNHSGEGPHLQCCKCLTYMAEKFVRAWFEILGPATISGLPKERS